MALRLGGDAGITYLTAYLLEKSLSVDNLFLFVLIFAQTGIPAALQHRALFWGVVGALVMRAILIGLGVYLLERFHWVIYLFAGAARVRGAADAVRQGGGDAAGRERAARCARAGSGG